MVLDMKKKSIFIILVAILSVVVLGCTLRKQSSENNFEKGKQEKVLSCRVKAKIDNNEDNEFRVTETYVYYFDIVQEKVTKYTQTMTFNYNSANAIEEYAEKNYNSFMNACDDLEDVSGIYCSVKSSEDTNLTVELKVVLSELSDDTELSDRLKNLKNASYERIYEDFKTSDTPWKCETYFE